MIVLDTNIVSELQKPKVHAAVKSWLTATGLYRTYICGPVLMEQAYGAELHFRRHGSPRYQRTLEKLLTEFADRTLHAGAAAWCKAGEVRAMRETHGRPISIGDAMIAAICLVHDATLATRNVRDFDGLLLKLVNPFEADA